MIGCNDYCHLIHHNSLNVHTQHPNIRQQDAFQVSGPAMNTAPEWCPVSHFGFNPGVPDNQTLDQCDHAPCTMAKLQTTVRDWACTPPRQSSCRSWTHPSLQTVVRDLACTRPRQLRRRSRWTNPSVIRGRVHS